MKKSASMTSWLDAMGLFNPYIFTYTPYGVYIYGSSTTWRVGMKSFKFQIFVLSLNLDLRKRRNEKQQTTTETTSFALAFVSSFNLFSSTLLY
jgi:hypothetical protein